MKKFRIVTLLMIMTIVTTGSTSVAMYTLYRTEENQQRARLQETVQSWARVIEAMARFDQRYDNLETPGTPFDATLLKIKEAHSNFVGFGKTGEFTLAYRQDDQIIFHLTHRHYDLENLKPVPFFSRDAEPMRRALMGESGTIIGRDYRGETVLAAYEPVKVYDLGIVAKMDLAEIQAPYYRAALQSAGFAIVFILLGTILFFRIGNPVMENLRRMNRELIKKTEEAQKAARTDDVTQLPNKRALVEDLGNPVSFSEDTSIGLIFIDLDNFKKINDSFGHKAGDRVLREIGDTLRQHIRDTDLVARVGGDEFVIVSKTKDRESLLEMANRIVETIHKMEENFPGTQFGASAGVVFNETPPESLDEMISHADRAMYMAKNSGKNMVVG